MKRKSSIVLLTTFISAALVVGVSTSVSWLLPYTIINSSENEITGTIEGAYYESGEGTPESPFVISQPRHLYNLAWLQYLGYYNKSEEKGKQYYFVLKNDIDMSEWTIPPIGTEQYPFIGNFDGQGNVLTGLKTSNSFSDFDRHPSVVHESTYNTNVPNIVGFFGVIGDMNNDYTNDDGTTKTGMVYSSSVNTLKNVGLSGTSVKTETNRSLVGMAAGYVDATISNIAIDSSSINISQASSAITDYTSNLSDYSVVGYATENYKKNITKVDETIYDVNIVSEKEYNATDDGDAEGWGGSINMKTIYNRIVSLRKTKSTDVSAYGNSTADYRIDRTFYGNEERTSERTTYNTVSRSNSTNDAYSRYVGANESGHTYIGNYNVYARAASSGYGSDTNTYGDQQYLYLCGGHYENNTYNDLYEHQGYKITDGNGHYLSVTSLTSNSGNDAGVLNNTDEANATVWNVPTSGSGYISASFHYNNSNNLTTYYLYVYNNTNLRLSASTNSRTSFTVSTGDNGKIRYVNGNYYLSYEATYWTMSLLPTAPNPTTYSSYLSDSYQISYGGNYLSKGNNNNTTGVATSITSANTYGWRFQYNNSDVTIQNAVGKAVKIYTVINNTKYYLYDSSNNSPWRMNLSNSANNGQTFTVSSNSDGTYRFTYSSYYFGWDSSNNVYSCRSENASGCYQSLTVQTTQSIVENYASTLAATYNLVKTTQTSAFGPDYSKNTTKSNQESHMYYTATDTTYLPLNVNKDTESYVSNASTMNSNISNGNLDPKDSNTGYIISGSNIASNITSFSGPANSNIRISRYAISNVNQSYNKSAGSTTTIADLPDSSVYTINTSGTTQTMNNALSANPDYYPRYSESKPSFFNNSLSSSTNGTTYTTNSYVYGLHFMNSTISKSSIVEGANVSILGNKCAKYQLPVDSIDFNLKQKGVINFFAGTYFDDNDSFFSIHQIVRNNDAVVTDSENNIYSSFNTINDIKEIVEIYSNDEGTKTTKYSNIYKYSDGTYSEPYRFDGNQNKYKMDKTSTNDLTTPYVENSTMNATDLSSYISTYGYTLRFKSSQIGKQSSAITSNRIYYFEFPMNQGEYCLGSVTGGTGAYLLYLDIGANAAKTQRTTIYEHFAETKRVFEYPLGVAIVATNEASASNTTFDPTNTSNAVIYASYVGVVTITRNDNDVTLDRTGGITNAKPTLVGELMWDDTHEQYNIHDPGGNNLSDEVLSEETVSDIRRVEFYDFNVNLDELTITLITDTSTNGGSSYVRTFEQQYQNGTSTTDVNSMNVYNDNGGVKYSVEDLQNQNTVKTYNSATGVNTTVLIEFRYEVTNTNSNELTIKLEMEIDEDITTGQYYKFKDYILYIIPNEGSVTIVVIQLGNKPIYIGDTLVTSVGQEIVVSAQ